MTLQVDPVEASADLPHLEGRFDGLSFEDSFAYNEETPTPVSESESKHSFAESEAFLNWLQSPYMSPYAEKISTFSPRLFSIEDVIQLRCTNQKKFENFVLSHLEMTDEHWEELELYLDGLERDLKLRARKFEAKGIKKFLKRNDGVKQDRKILKIANTELQRDLLKWQQHKEAVVKQLEREEAQRVTASLCDRPIECEPELETEEEEIKRKVKNANKNDKKIKKHKKDLQAESKRKVENLNKKKTNAENELASHQKQVSALMEKLQEVTQERQKKSQTLSEQLSELLKNDNASRYASHLVQWGINTISDLNALNLHALRNILEDVNDMEKNDMVAIFQFWAENQQSSSTFRYLVGCVELDGDIQKYGEALYLLGIELNQDGTFTTSSQNLEDFFEFASVSENDREFFKRHHFASGSSGQTHVSDLSEAEQKIIGQHVKEWLSSVDGIKEHYISPYSELFLKNNCTTVGDVIEIFQHQPKIFGEILSEFMGGYRPIVRASIREKIKQLGAAKTSTATPTPTATVDDDSKRDGGTGEQQNIEHFLQSLVQVGLDASVIETYCESFAYYNVGKIGDLQQLQPKAQRLVLEGVVMDENHRKIIRNNLPSNG